MPSSTKTVRLQGQSIPIREFKLEWMVPNASICMIAKRGGGKSYMVRAILKHYKNIPGGLIIAPTDRMSTFYSKFFPNSFIFYKYKSSIIEKIMGRQQLMIKKMKDKIKKGKKCNPRAFVVMDDCLSSRGAWMKDECIQKLFFEGRHYQIMYIFTMQFPLGIKPEMRCNFDYIFLFAEDFISNQKRIHDHYAGMFPNFNAFKQVFAQLTKNYGCMVIVNRGARKGFLDKVFWYRAKNETITKMGSNQFNNFHKNNYNKDWEENDGFDVEKYFDQKKKSNIVVDVIRGDKP
uniref:Packaging ATPase n=1 Tax=Mimivirus LCMiAC01 TaxID=2506608 RepID=A0A481Z138_9VIRU|nr:MAG: packaging ATPase [Mimivirus LCMiAC01]